jgi:hypothetical protein
MQDNVTSAETLHVAALSECLVWPTNPMFKGVSR